MPTDDTQHLQSIDVHIDVDSPFKNRIELFDNKEMFPDMEMVVPGLEKPLLLHRGIMANASKLIRGLLNSKQTGLSMEPNKIEWMFDTTNARDREALVKVLRFCYDETMRVELNKGEFCAVITALFRLQVSRFDQVLKTLCDFAVEQTRNDVKIGAELLKETQLYPECCSANTFELDKILAKVVFTAKNIYENHAIVVDECLMKLPMEYLDMVEYGDPHTENSEFSVRMKYLKENGEKLSKEDKETIIKNCDWSKLRSNELNELKRLGIVGLEIMTEIYSRVLECVEKESDEHKKHSKRAERDSE